MARISPAAPEQFAQVAEHMERWKQTKGYPPNSWLTMVRKPRVFRAYRDLHTAVMMEAGEVPKALKFMVAYVVSAAAGCCPPRVTDEHVAELKKYYSEDAVTEIVAVISLLGWLNRWNITLATRIETAALAFAERHLAPSGWTPGMHADTIPVSRGRTE